MLFVRAQIDRWVAGEPQPGLVEVALVDAQGKRWTFVDKIAIFSSEALTSDSNYQRDILIACEQVGSKVDSGGREIVTISTARPWGIETPDHISEFEVESGELVQE